MFPHIRSGLPPQPNEVGAVGKRQSSGMNELSPKVEASDMELVKPPMGGNVFSERPQQPLGCFFDARKAKSSLLRKQEGT